MQATTCDQERRLPLVMCRLVMGCWIIMMVTCGALAQALEIEETQEPALWENLRGWSEKGEDWLDQLDFSGLADEYEFVGFDEWQDFFARILDVLRGDSYEGLQILLPYVREGLSVLRQLPDAQPYADWLEQRLDYFEVADEIVRAEHTPRPSPVPQRVFPVPARPPVVPPKRPMPPPPPIVQTRRDKKAADAAIWQQLARKRSVPARASTLVPVLKAVFREEGMPEALVWIAEIESSFNPEARSPAGAVGLFQFMPTTAQQFGLTVQPEDQRLSPTLSARAAAKYLRALYRRFNDWPLAFAAYNAGEGRVARLLRARAEKSFAAIESALPVETRMYVPKILAVISVREGIDVRSLPPPRASTAVMFSPHPSVQGPCSPNANFTMRCAFHLAKPELAEWPIPQLLWDRKRS